LYVKEFKHFLTELEQPLGLGDGANEVLILERIQALNLPVYQGRVYLEDALLATAHRVASISNPCLGMMRNAADNYIATAFKQSAKGMSEHDVDMMQDVRIQDLKDEIDVCIRENDAKLIGADSKQRQVMMECGCSPLSGQSKRRLQWTTAGAIAGLRGAQEHKRGQKKQPKERKEHKERRQSPDEAVPGEVKQAAVEKTQKDSTTPPQDTPSELLTEEERGGVGTWEASPMGSPIVSRSPEVLPRLKTKRDEDDNVTSLSLLVSSVTTLSPLGPARSVTSLRVGGVMASGSWDSKKLAK